MAALIFGSDRNLVGEGGELVFADTAEGAGVIVGEFFKGCAGGDAVFGVTYFGVIYPVAYVANIFFHNLYSFKCGVKGLLFCLLNAGWHFFVRVVAIFS